MFVVGATVVLPLVPRPMPTPVMEQEFGTAVPGEQLQVSVAVPGGTTVVGDALIVQSGKTVTVVLPVPPPESVQVIG